ncbi:MAG: DNA topoisomerase IB [Candidatus Eremiobacteraeota bacterium]|nr:DNA topoisomerase IB [Candidatus Eremiobacteraeota bacterium]MBV8498112.1 DNA topoisomerase IB [Candidatus Eremiobacteraeota bacterium]
MDAQAVARDAGLRYLDDRLPGIRRRRHGRSFKYVHADGRPVRDEAELRRIRALAIPPAYTDVWISPIPNGHMQATGRDARGRKQYRYHKRWRDVRDEAKYHRLAAFGRALPKIRAAVAKDLEGDGLTRRKVLAAVVKLLDATGVRVGNEEYAQANGSFGLTTLRTRHVSLNGRQVRLDFRGKTGRRHLITLDDARLARIIKRCRDLPGEELFTYVDEAGAVASVSSDDVNGYIREIAGDDFSAKDFRTWIGTVECIAALTDAAEQRADAKSNVKAALERVAARLGNTPAVCRKAYVHPAVIETYTRLRRLPAGNGRAGAKRRAGALSHRERSALRFVERWEKSQTLAASK